MKELQYIELPLLSQDYLIAGLTKRFEENKEMYEGQATKEDLIERTLSGLEETIGCFLCDEEAFLEMGDEVLKFAHRGVDKLGFVRPLDKRFNGIELDPNEEAVMDFIDELMDTAVYFSVSSFYKNGLLGQE